LHFEKLLALVTTIQVVLPIIEIQFLDVFLTEPCGMDEHDENCPKEGKTSDHDKT